MSATSESNVSPVELHDSIAVIGMSASFPGAKDINTYWHNICNGIESISTFDDHELIESNLPYELIHNKNYIKRAGFVSDVEYFDENLFNFTPTDATLQDPQHRIFLEHAWQALEVTGYLSETHNNKIGVFSGTRNSTYFTENILNSDDPILQHYDSVMLRVKTSNEFLSTLVSYKLNLKGPSLSISTACSTGLVAINTACQYLLYYECDLAVAGATSVRVPQKQGYLYQPGSIYSKSGKCSPFDANADGTLFSDGVGVVVLKRLVDAINDNDNIIAVIRGFALNNDGSNKVAYSAPSFEGQKSCIATAINSSVIDPRTIAYVECHGTGTLMGDPLEVKALSDAYRMYTQEKNYCGIGSVKANIGHTDVASGMAGFIKAVLMVQHRKIPKQINFESPNPLLEIDNSPFLINTETQDYTHPNTPMRVAVSSFGFGGTNAHAILEEGFTTKATHPSQSEYPIVISAKSRKSLQSLCSKMQTYCEKSEQSEQKEPPSIADLAFTLQDGRKHFNHRLAFVGHDCNDIANHLSRISDSIGDNETKPNMKYNLVFAFPGQGSQFPGMAQELYFSNDYFRSTVDYCVGLAENCANISLKPILFISNRKRKKQAELLNETLHAQLCLFIIEYALAKYLMRCGIVPSCMIGHSIGEYTAACIANVLSLEDTIKMISIRGKLMRKTSPGQMLALELSEKTILSLIDSDLSLALINSKNQCVVAGTENAIKRFEKKLTTIVNKPVRYSRLASTKAFHSYMMDEILDQFAHEIKDFKFSAPSIPYISNVTGTWIREEEVTNINYWIKHLRQTVRFKDGIDSIQELNRQIFLEVGPGNTISYFVEQQLKKETDCKAIHLFDNTTKNRFGKTKNKNTFLNGLCKLWELGIDINWSKLRPKEPCKLIPLPTYAFDRKRYWIDTSKKNLKFNAYRNWFHEMTWSKRSYHSEYFQQYAHDNCLSNQQPWLLFCDQNELTDNITSILTELNIAHVLVMRSSEYQKHNQHHYSINQENVDDYKKLVKQLAADNITPTIILHLWNTSTINQPTNESYNYHLYSGFFSLLFLSQALTSQYAQNPIRIITATTDVYNASGCEQLSAIKSTIIGSCKVIPQEQPNIQIKLVDFTNIENKTQNVAQQILFEAATPHQSNLTDCIAYRNNQRFQQSYPQLELETTTNQPSKIRPNGVYLITGGSGGVGHYLLDYLVSQYQANVINLVRHPKQQSDEQTDEQNHVWHMAVDITDAAALENAIAAIKSKYPKIDGVIHMAGVPGKGLAQLKQEESAFNVFAPKIQGTDNLLNCLKNEPLDFFVLFSSLSSVMGGIGQVDYTAANAYLDSIAINSPLKNTKQVVSISWNTWQNTGMSKRLPGCTFNNGLTYNSISPFVGPRVFEDALKFDCSHVIISTTPLPQKINQNQMQEEVPTEKTDENSIKTQENNIHDHDFVLKSLTRKWEEIIGVSDINPCYNLYHYGGDSLSALRLLADIASNWSVEIPLAELEAVNNLNGLAERIVDSLTEEAPTVG